MNKKKSFKLIFMSGVIAVLFCVKAFAVGWVDDGGGNWRYVDADNTYLTDTIKMSGNNRYYIDVNGYMVRDYLLEDYNEAIYYFDEEGKMVTSTWVAVDQTQVYNQMDNPPSIYLYYFGSNGKAYKAKSGVSKRVIDGKKYLFNENGQMLSGWINEQGERFNELDDTEADPFVGYVYYAGDETDGVLREGWAAWEEGSTDDKYYKKEAIWFYFKTNDNKKVHAAVDGNLTKKTINGRTYSFDYNGVMTEGWDAEAIDPNNEDVSVTANNYFTEEGEAQGHLAKKTWIYAVPSQKQDLDDHDAEVKRWFYSNGGGTIVKGVMKKINSNFYTFDKTGIMKSGLCVITKGTKTFVDTIDAEKTDGKDFIISRYYISGDNSSGANVFARFDDETQSIFYFETDEENKDDYGKRKFLNSMVSFGDDDYYFSSKSTGEYEGYKNKKYYQNGILLKADQSLGLGLVFVGYSDSKEADSVNYKPVYNNSTHTFAKPDKNHDDTLSDYIVLRKSEATLQGKYPVYSAVDTAGKKLTKSYSVKKDKTGNYWAIGANATVIGVYEVPIKYNKSEGKWMFQSEAYTANGRSTRKKWLYFGSGTDVYGKTCYTDRDNQGAYALDLNDAYALNFRYADN